jgi:hypothetical protein
MILINGTKCTVQKCMAFHCMLNKMVIFIPYHVIIISQLNNEVLYIYHLCGTAIDLQWKIDVHLSACVIKSNTDMLHFKLQH